MSENTVEEWRDILGYEGSYQVSNLGRVRSLDRILQGPPGVQGYPRSSMGRVLKLKTVLPNGYIAAVLSCPGKGKTNVYVSHLVAAAFIGPRPPGLEVAHKDGKKPNNRVDNLRYCTPAENAADRAKHGTQVRGARCHMAKLTDADVLAIRRRRASSNETLKVIGLDFGLSASATAALVRRASWKHLP